MLYQHKSYGAYVSCKEGWGNFQNDFDTMHPPSSLMDSIANPKVKTIEGEGVRVCSMACNTSGVKAHARILKWGLGRLTSKSITHTKLYKPNNKLVSA
jgi:hypothetical protein